MKKSHTLIVKTNRQLDDLQAQKAIQQGNLRINLSRRKVPMAIHKALFTFKGKIIWPDGSTFKKPLCIFTEFDPDNRWYSLFRQTESEGNPLRKSEKFTRLRLIDLWHQIRDLEGLDLEE